MQTISRQTSDWQAIWYANSPSTALISDGPGSNIFDPGLVGSVTSGFGKFPLKLTIFQFFSLGVKKIISGQVKTYPGQKNAQVGSVCSPLVA